MEAVDSVNLWMAAQAFVHVHITLLMCLLLVEWSSEILEQITNGSQECPNRQVF